MIDYLLGVEPLVRFDCEQIEAQIHKYAENMTPSSLAAILMTVADSAQLVHPTVATALYGLVGLIKSDRTEDLVHSSFLLMEGVTFKDYSNFRAKGIDRIVEVENCPREDAIVKWDSTQGDYDGHSC